MAEQPAPLPPDETPLQPTAGIELPSEPKRGRSGCFYFLVGGLGCLLILLAIPAAAVLFGVTTVASISRSVENIIAPVPSSATVVPSQSIVTGILPLGQLVSFSVQLAKADIFVGIQQGTLNACGFSANHVAQGAVEAGIDLTSVSAEDISYDTASDTYTVRLPAPELTSCRVDYIRQYERSVTACNVDWDEARLIASYTSVVDFRNDALEGGILSRAAQQSQLVLGSFLEGLTGANVEIEFVQPETVSLPASCDPAVPTGWSIDPATGAWVRN